MLLKGGLQLLNSSLGSAPALLPLLFIKQAHYSLWDTNQYGCFLIKRRTAFWDEQVFSDGQVVEM